MGQVSRIASRTHANTMERTTLHRYRALMDLFLAAGLNEEDPTAHADWKMAAVLTGIQGWYTQIFLEKITFELVTSDPHTKITKKGPISLLYTLQTCFWETLGLDKCESQTRHVYCFLFASLCQKKRCHMWNPMIAMCIPMCLQGCYPKFAALKCL